ncbi:MAG: hypothetical protein A3G34_05810 [Candidatus Lindowbacteria bacterium RIFCSPLOWO2_12_FULL_62_27]|nr:MAG: hypothetical protein A3G34_05810 [Candidatus Lindowbacteria bacterium RIFCSPLOWO2_12_FULL_62_27]OGH63720.1 MAG: hypothetical protein A3I06_09200 [Candidatus Lindowbacteria bacterium RIFCSPLOWO2_02_FULL_62_12]
MTVSAVIDTGFNEYLSVPARLLKRLGWNRIGIETYELASGEKMESDTYLGIVIFGGKRRQVVAVAGSPSEVLIGTRLLDGMELRINFVSGRVAIENASR